MRETTISRNYAEALLSLAQRAGDAGGWGAMISDVASAVEGDQSLRLFLESPRVSAVQKNEVLLRAFQDRMPRHMLRFLQTLVRNRRQMLIPQIARDYHALLDEVEGRVHVSVTVAHALDADGERMIAGHLARVLGKEVVSHVIVNPSIIGGVIARVGDTVLDGSVRRRISALRSRLV